MEGGEDDPSPAAMDATSSRPAYDHGYRYYPITVVTILVRSTTTATTTKTHARPHYVIR